MAPENAPAVTNQNQSEEVKRPCYKEHLIHTVSPFTKIVERKNVVLEGVSKLLTGTYVPVVLAFQLKSKPLFRLNVCEAATAVARFCIKLVIH